MKEIFNWKSNIFSFTYNIFSDGILIGKLNNRVFNQTIGELAGKNYIFKKIGLFKQKTLVIDEQLGQVIGEINFNGWMSKATFSFQNKQVSWKFDNVWETEWSISDKNNMQIECTSSFFGGQIYSNSGNALFLLSGLYVSKIYKQTNQVAILLSLFTIWITIFH